MVKPNLDQGNLLKKLLISVNIYLMKVFKICHPTNPEIKEDVN